MEGYPERQRCRGAHRDLEHGELARRGRLEKLESPRRLGGGQFLQEGPPHPQVSALGTPILP